MTDLQARPISALLYRDWFDENYSCLDNRTPFHQPDWLEVVDRGSRCRVAFIGLWQGADLIGALPLYLARRGPLRLAGSPLRGAMTSYLGPTSLRHTLTGSCMPEVLTLCREVAREHWRADYFEVTLRDAPRDGVGNVVRDFPQDAVPRSCRGAVSRVKVARILHGWASRTPQSYRLDLRPGEEAIWNDLKGRTRRNIRKAERAGIKIVPLYDADAYFRLHRETFARRGMAPPHEARFFDAIFHCLLPRDRAWALASEHQGNRVAAGIFLHDDRETLYISGASPSEHVSLPTSHLLHWHVITRSVQSGHLGYDFVGRGVPSIDHFKASFSPKIVDYWSVSWAPWPVRLAESTFTAAKPLVAKAARVRAGK